MSWYGNYETEGETEEKVRKGNQLLKHFDESISEETEKFVINTVFRYSRYIFITKEDKNIFLNGANEKFKKVYGYCTHCKERYELSQAQVMKFTHNSQHTCPKCKSKCVIKHAKYRRSTLADRALFITYDKSLIDKETIVAKGYFVTRDYSGKYEEVSTKYEELSRYVFAPEGSFMLTKYNYYGWGVRKGCYSYRDNYGGYNEYVDNKSIIRAVRNTRFRYSPYKIYMGDGNGIRRDNDMTRFFYAYNRYPVIEKLIKIGFKRIADRMIDGASLERSVRFKQTDLFKFLNLNRGQVKEIKSNAIDPSPSFLNMYRFSCKENLGWDCRKIDSISLDISLEKLKEIKKYAGIKKTINYLEKQKTIKKTGEKDGISHTYYNLQSTLGGWFDYIKDCKELTLNVTDSSILFPKDLYVAHQNTIKQIKYIENKELDKKIEKVAKKIDSYKFGYKNLIIRPASSAEELIKEGEKLHHCVGGYAKRYARGETYILVIRNKDKIDTPYYTIEINKKGELVQVRGKRNCDANEEVEEFMREFKKKKLYKKSKRKIA